MTTPEKQEPALEKPPVDPARPLKTKQVYAYHPQTGEFSGGDVAHESPLEPGTFHVPGGATETPPPPAVPGKARVWTGSAWSYVADYRDQTAFETATRRPAKIQALGELPAGLTLLKPSTLYDAWDGSAWVTDSARVKADEADALRRRRNALLAASDWTQLGDAPLSEAQRAAWKKYRQALRDLMATGGSPPAPPA